MALNYLRITKMIFENTSKITDDSALSSIYQGFAHVFY